MLLLSHKKTKPTNAFQELSVVGCQLANRLTCRLFSSSLTFRVRWSLLLSSSGPSKSARFPLSDLVVFSKAIPDSFRLLASTHELNSDHESRCDWLRLSNLIFLALEMRLASERSAVPLASRPYDWQESPATEFAQSFVIIFHL